METKTSPFTTPGLGVAVAGIALATALVFATLIGAKSFEYAKRSQITVKGFATKAIVSDLAHWEGVVKTRHRDLAEAYKRLEADRMTILQFLDKLDVPPDAVDFSATRTEVLRKREGYNETHTIEGYQLEQSFSLRSTDTDLVQRVAAETTQLLKKGIEISSKAPLFYFSGLEDLKVEMLAQATRDARARAQSMAQNSGSELGSLRSAQQGVFQITRENSVEVSGYGENDTSSLKKIIRAVVTVEYGLK